MKTRKTAKKLLAMVLACLMLATIAACGNKGNVSTNEPASSENTSPGVSPESSPGSGGSGGANTSGGGNASEGGNASGGAAGSSDSVRTVTVTLTSDPGSLHPFTHSLGGFMDVGRTYMDTLFDFKSDGTIDWRLATSYDTISEIEHTVHLREGVTFSNGNPFTAEDVIFSMELIHNHPQWGMNVETVDFEKTKVIDDHTLDLWFMQYDVGQFFGLMQLWIFDAETYDEADIAVHPVGTGPYVVTDYVINSHVTCEAREGYWGPEPSIKRIQFKVMSEDSQRVNALTTGEVDVTTIPLKDVDYVESLGNYDVTTVLAASISAAYFNVTEGTPLGSLKARQAVMHAIDRESIVDMVFSGMSSAPRWPVSEANRDFEPRFANMDDVYSIGYDPVRARELAEEAGLVGQTLRIMTNGAQDFIMMAEIIQNNLGEIGVNAQIINYDQATYWGLLMDQSNYEIALYLVAGPKLMAIDLLTAFPQFFTLGWEGPDRDAYIELALKGISTSDNAARSETLYELVQKFLDIQLWYPLAEAVSARVSSKDITGVDYYMDSGIHIDRWSWA